MCIVRQSSQEYGSGQQEARRLRQHGISVEI
jgi:hypothetical protein